MSFPDQQISPATRRHKDRARRLMRGLLTRAGGQAQAIVVRNLSPSGLGGSMSSGGPLQRGDRVDVDVAGGLCISGLVRWVKGHAFGMEFDSEINMQTIDRHVAGLNDEKRSVGQESDFEVMRFYRGYAATPQVMDPRRIRRV